MVLTGGNWLFFLVQSEHSFSLSTRRVLVAELFLP